MRHSKRNFKWRCVKALIGEWRGGKRSADSFFFFSANASGNGWYKQQNTKTIQGHSKGSKGPDTNIFESLILKLNRAEVNVESKESICVVLKYNTLTRDGL